MPHFQALSSLRARCAFFLLALGCAGTAHAYGSASVRIPGGNGGSVLIHSPGWEDTTCEGSIGAIYISCSIVHPINTNIVTLTARPYHGYALQSWSRDCSGGAATITFVYPASGNFTCDVNFVAVALTVNNAGDPGSGNAANCAVGNANTCTLRDAVAAAAGGSETIVFDAAITQIGLRNELVLGDSSGSALTIDGAGRVTLDGGGTTRLLRSVAGSNTQLLGLTLRNAESDSGSAIQNAGTLALRRSRVENNHASGYGGGIANGGVLTIEQSAITRNRADGGGAGLYNTGISVRTTASTFAYNATTSLGGAIHVGAGNVELINATLSGNIAGIGSGLYVSLGSADVRHTTIWGNAGPAYSGQLGAAAFTNSLVENCLLGFGGLPAFFDKGGNRVGDTSCNLSQPTSLAGANVALGGLADNGGPTQTMMPAPGSQALDSVTCDSAVPVDQRGARRPAPNTSCDAGAVERDAWFALSIRVIGNGRVDSAHVGGAWIDACRADGGVCAAYLPNGQSTVTATADAGYKFAGWGGDCSGTAPVNQVTMDNARSCTATFVPDIALVVNSTGDPTAGDALRCLAGNANTCSLRDAVAAAHGGDTITFAPTISAIALKQQIAFAAIGGATLKLRGESKVRLYSTSYGGRVLKIADGANVAIAGIAIGGFLNTAAGISNAGNLSLSDCTLYSNVIAGGKGGALHNIGAAAQATLTNCTLSGNSAYEGSAIYNEGGRVSGRNVTFAGNRSGVSVIGPASGGPGIVSDQGAIRLANSLVQGCAVANGGAIVDDGGNLDSDATCGLPPERSNAALNLGALATSSGGGLPVQLPGVGSAAIDAGLDAICNDAATVAARDQRGVARPQGTHCDAGAVEVRLYRFSGSASDQNGDVVLRLGGSGSSGAQDLTVAATATSFAFPRALPEGASWAVRVVSAPAGRACTVSPADGTALAADVSTLALRCVDNALTVSANHTDTSCYGGANGSASVNASGGTPPYSYRWNPGGATSHTATGLAAGDYTVTVTDSLGATASAQATIASPPPIVFVTTTLTPGRYGAAYSTTLSASGGAGALSYRVGSGGSPPPGLTLASTGALTVASAPAKSYQFPVTVTDSNSCTPSQTLTLVIAPAPLTVSANDATRVYGAANPAFSARYAGFVNGDTAANLTPALTFTTTALANSPAGAYAIVPSGTVGTNYVPTFVNGTLTITRAAQAITNFAATPARPGFVVGNKFSVSATPGASTSPLVFASTSPNVCSVSAATVTMLAFGTCTLTADQAADANFGAAPTATLSVPFALTASMALSATPNPVRVGDPLLLSARIAANGTPMSTRRATTVSAKAATAVPSGTVTFYDGAVAIGSGTLDTNGVASISTSTLAAGAHTLSAVYAGDVEFAQASATLTVTILLPDPPVPAPALPPHWLVLLGTLLAALATWHLFPRRS